MAPVKKELAPLGRTYIAEWRESRSMTQEALAERIDLSRSTLSKIETSDSPYTQRTLEAIARALDCGPCDLLMPVGAEERKVSGDDAILALLHRVDGLDQRGVELAFAVITNHIEATRRTKPSPDDVDGQPSIPTGRRASLPSR